MILALASTAALAQGLSLSEDAHWLDAATEIALGDAHTSLSDGLLFAVETEGGDVAGFVFVGEGSLGFPFADRGEALAMAAGLDLPQEATWSEGLDVLLVLGTDPQLLGPLATPVVEQDQRALRWTDPQGGEHVVVTALRIGEARRTAEGVLRRRTERLTQVGLDPVAMLAQDALRDGEPRTIVEARTDRVWLPLLEPAFRTTQDTWLTWIRDPTGAVDDRYRDVVAVHGVGEGEAPRFRALTGTPHPDDVERARIDHGTANVVIRGGGSDLDVRVEALLTVTAEVATPLLDLEVPRPDGQFLGGRLPTTPEYHLEEVALADGAPLERVGAPWGPGLADPAWDASTWRLPSPLQPGQPQQVRVIWTMQWPAANRLMVLEWAIAQLESGAVDCTGPVNGEIKPGTCAWIRGGIDGFPEYDELGRVAAAQPVMPRVPGVPGTYAAEVRVATTLGKAWEVAIGSGATEERSVGNGRVWIADTRSDARVSVGDLRVSEASAVAGFPAVRILKHSPFDGGSPEFVRAVLNFYSTALPAWPHEEVVIVQAPDLPVLYAGQPERAGQEERFPHVDGYPGHLVLTGLRSYPIALLGGSGPVLKSAVDKNHPHAVERGMAEALASGWWQRMDWGRREAWLAEALPGLYRDLFFEDAFDEDDVQTWRRTTTDPLLALAPDRFAQPLQGRDDPWTGEVGARLFGDALRHRIGEESLLEGLSRFLEAGDPTLDALEASLEEAGGVELEGFFDAWVVAGLRPRVRGTWTPTDAGVHVRLQADVPYGEWEVPVVLTSRKGARTTWVKLVDGVGEADLVGRGAVVRVEVDPESWLPLRGRAMDREGEGGSTGLPTGGGPMVKTALSR